ncbi:MAG: hypothetical protein ACP5VE_10165 [Chthonomonadales bacterium]
MYTFEQHITVRLQFGAMEEPVEISVPLQVLRYLDRHADRRLAPDGTVVYMHPRDVFDAEMDRRQSVCGAAVAA